MALHPSQWKELFTRYREIIMYVLYNPLYIPERRKRTYVFKMDVQAQFQRRGFFNGIAQHHIVDSVGDICVYHEQDMGISKQGKGCRQEYSTGTVILCGKAVHAVC